MALPKSLNPFDGVDKNQALNLGRAHRARFMQIIERLSSINQEDVYKNHYIYSPPGLGKTFSIKKHLDESKTNYIQVSGNISMFAFGIQLAVIDYMNVNRENIIVFVDDCDVVFSTEQSLNQMKILLDKDSRTFNYEKSLQTQWGNLSDIQKQAILAHQNDDKLGFSVDCSLMAFVFTSNFKLPNDDMVKIAREKNQGKSLLMAHRNAIRSRCKVADFDLEPSAHWGWIADVVLHTECISDDKMTKDEKIIMLNFLWDNWNELNERSIRLIEKMVETKIQHPESFKLIWEIDHIK